MNHVKEYQPISYNQKVTVAGNRLWLVQFSKNRLRNPSYPYTKIDEGIDMNLRQNRLEPPQSPKDGGGDESQNFAAEIPVNATREQIRREDSVIRSKRRLEQLCYANATPARRGFTFDKFLTLTYADTSRAQPHNHALQQADFRRFVRKLRALYPSMSFVAVGELQTKNGRNALHWHLLCFNVPYGDFRIQTIAALWGLGHAYVLNVGKSNTKKTRRIGYISKYIIKGKVWKNASNHLYQRSGTLKEPATYYHPDNVHEALSVAPLEVIYRGQWKEVEKLNLDIRYIILERKNPTIAGGSFLNTSSRSRIEVSPTTLQ